MIAITPRDVALVDVDAAGLNLGGLPSTILRGLLY